MADSINCFFNLTSQYKPNKKVRIISGDTPRLSNDNLENCFGGRLGKIKDTKSNTATILLHQNNIFPKNDSFFKIVYVIYLQL